jgi:outer membrane protein assembly factor BamB
MSSTEVLMNRKQLPLVIGLAVLGLFMAGCPDKPPATPTVISAPDTTWVQATTPVRVVTTQPKNKDVVYIVDRATDAVDTVGEAASGETTTVYLPAWTAVGTYTWKLAAAVKENPTLVSGWTEDHSIYVAPNSPPGNLILTAPNVAVKDVPASFTVSADDPEGDSIEFYFDFGDGSKGWIDTMLASPATLTVRHTYTSFDTVWVNAKARDKKRSECAPCSSEVKIGSAGGVLWVCVPSVVAGDSYPVYSSPAFVAIGSDTLVYSGGCDDGKLWSVRFGSGREKSAGNNVLGEEGELFGAPVYVRQTGHIVAACSDGELYAFAATNLGDEWRYPDKHRDSLDGKPWGALAVKGDLIYGIKDCGGMADTIRDTIFCIQDGGTQGVRLHYYVMNLLSEELSIPVIDNNGDVLFAAESMFVYKMDANLSTIIWRRRFDGATDIHTLALGDDGSIYVTTSEGIVYALDPATGNDRWATQVEVGRDAWQLVVGNGVLYVTTDACRVVALNPTTGGKNWETTLEQNGLELKGAPVLASKYLYCLDEEDNVYCVDVSVTPGVLLWKCNCPSQLGGLAPRRTRLSSNEIPALTIGPDGSIIVVGIDAMYRVAGYTDGLLSGTRWPKWQRDLYNNGYYNSTP